MGDWQLNVNSHRVARTGCDRTTNTRASRLTNPTMTPPATSSSDTNPFDSATHSSRLLNDHANDTTSVVGTANAHKPAVNTRRNNDRPRAHCSPSNFGTAGVSLANKSAMFKSRASTHTADVSQIRSRHPMPPTARKQS